MYISLKHPYSTFTIYNTKSNSISKGEEEKRILTEFFQLNSIFFLINIPTNGANNDCLKFSEQSYFQDYKDVIILKSSLKVPFD